MLSKYNITDETVIHLVAKTLDEQELSGIINQLNQSQQDHQGNLDDLFNVIIEIPILRENRRTRRRRANGQIKVSASLQYIRFL